MIWLRRIFMCWWGGCDMELHHDRDHIYWLCPHCQRKDYR